MKKFLGLGLITGILMTTSVNSFARCQDQYLEKIKNNKTVAEKICAGVSNCEYGMLLLGQVGSFFIVGSATSVFGLIPFTLLIADAVIEDAVHDKYYRDIIRLTSYAEYKSGAMPFPDPNLLGSAEPYIIDESGNEKKVVRKANRDIKRSNRRLEKAKAAITKELERSEKAFNKFYSKVSKEIPGTSAEEVAEIVAEANKENLLCNGSIGAFGEDVTIRHDYVIENGASRKERRAQRRHNRAIDKHNQKSVKKLDKNRLAKKHEIIDFIERNLEN